ncbi:MAG: hypothetical protein GY827_10335 [Cytophagales bacterium]|nr:hypothetical protein [Cytophagales bacterium]
MNKKLIITSIIGLLILGVVAGLFSTSGRYYGSTSPDKQFRLYTSMYNYERILGTEREYAAGKVFLVDLTNDKVIDEAPISWIGASLDAQWTNASVFFKCDKCPFFKLPRDVKLPYNKEYENGVIKRFNPDGSIIKEFQVVRTKHRIYKVGKETAYDGNGLPFLVTTYEYYPDSIPGRIPDSLLTKIVKQDSYRKGKLIGHREYRNNLKENRTCNCGRWINYQYHAGPDTTEYQNCNDNSWDCR